jgi:hypothetical protein
MPVVCPSGQILSADGLRCVPDPSMGTMQTGEMIMGQSQQCPPGQKLVGDICKPIVCPVDQKLVGSDCVPDPSMGTMQTGEMIMGQSQQCPPGQKLVGDICKPIVCPVDQKLVGSDCVYLNQTTTADAGAEKPAAEKAAAEKATYLNQIKMGESQIITNPAMTLADKAAAQVFAAAAGVCPPGMTDTRDGYCQPPMVPFLTSSGAMAGGDASAATAASGSDAYGTTGATGATGARIPQTGPCPPNTTPVPDKGCLPEKILSWAPGAILIPYLADLSVSLNSINTAIKNTTKVTNPIAVAINNAASKNSKSIDNVAKGTATATAITDAIATLSTSMETINTSIQGAAAPATSYGGGRRTRRRRGRRARKTRR